MLGFRHFSFGSSPAFELTISSPVYNPNVRSLAIANGWSGAGLLIINVNATINTLDLRGLGLTSGWHLKIASGVRVGGIAGDKNNNNRVNGGDAISVDSNGIITNLGIISGGGGGGGVGGSVTVTSGGLTESANAGQPGIGDGFRGSGVVWGNRTAGSPVETVGVGPTAGPGGYLTYAFSGSSGGGGAAGASGEDGGFADVTGPYSSAVFTDRELGGRGGNAVVGNSFIDWQAVGTIIGSRI